MSGPGSPNAASGVSGALREALAAAARAPVLLVASDFDGTLAPLAARPEEARADAGAMEALAGLAQAAHTHAAVISGRSLAQLRRLTGRPRKVRLVGSHGAEPGSQGMSLTASGEALLLALHEELLEIAARAPGLLVEEKPAGMAFHFRMAAEEAARSAAGAVLSGPAKRDGVFVLHGHKVIELSLVRPDKGKALAAVRERVGAIATVFIGDDATDEGAFSALGPGDVGVKIGAGDESAAKFRVESQAEVAGLLTELLAARRATLEQLRPTPIERHSILSDQRTVAVVDPGARIVWLCVPRVDASALFAELVGGSGAGYFAVEPAGGGEARQEYVGDSFVLRTSWGGLSVTDYFDCTAGRPYQRAGRTDLIRVLEGTGRAVVRFSPRLDFGRQATRLVPREGGLEVDGCPDPIVLYAPGVAWTVAEDGTHQVATAEIELTGHPVTMELRYGVGNLKAGVLKEPERRKQTERFWSGWTGTLRLPSKFPEQVKRSALVLKALCHGPTGAIVAAGTTSLPAPLGGVRNWDYRYCWPRDACLSAAALIRLGNTGTAMKLLDWLVGVVDALESPERLRPIYTVSGGHLGPEAEIGSLAGYGRSRPVRVGNAASNQVQLDVFGPIVDVVALLSEAGAPITPQYWRLVEAMVRAVGARWQEPDHGIWELRTHKRQHVHTKVMCWHAVNRGMAVAEQMLGRVKADWATLRDRIAADVLEHGWNEHAGAFTSAYGERSLDAAALVIGLTGLVPPADPRFLATVEAVQGELRRGATVYRYHYDDGLPGIEGGFNLCTAWLIEALALVGRREEALELLEKYAALAGPTGLMSEQFDPETGLALGNFPQAYSHLGLINAAVRLERSG